MKKIKFDSEYILHKLTQENLDLFKLKFVASERQLIIPEEKYDCLRLGDTGFDEDGKELTIRVDNIAFDENTKELVIIEYKNELEPKVLKQAEKYRRVVKKYIDVFNRRKYDEFGKPEKKQIEYPVNENNIRVMIIAPEFTEEQLQNDEDDIELWKVSLYDNGKVTYENMKTNDEIKELNIDLDDLDFTEQKTLKGKGEENIKLYYEFKDKVMDNYNESIDFRFLVDAVSFRTNNQIVCIFHLSNKPKIHYFTDKLIDCENKTRDISEITTGGKANYELVLSSESDIDYAFDLFEQVYLQKNEE